MAANGLPAGWKKQKGHLVGGYRFKDFERAMTFVNAVADRAEKVEHHPDFHIHWNEVQFEVWSHDEGKVTERDRALVADIAKIARRQKGRKLTRRQPVPRGL